MKQEAKTLGEGGLLLLGDQYTGQHVLVTQEGDGVWTVKTAEVVPHNERWLKNPLDKAILDEALTWSEQNPARASTPQEIEALFEKALEGK